VGACYSAPPLPPVDTSTLIAPNDPFYDIPLLSGPQISQNPLAFDGWDDWSGQCSDMLFPADDSPIAGLDSSLSDLSAPVGMNSMPADPYHSPAINTQYTNFPDCDPELPSQPLYAPTASPPKSSATSASPAPRDKSPKDKERPDRVVKRQQNTQAARRYRQKKLDKMDSLEAELRLVQRERDELRVQVARLQGETETLRGLLKGENK